MKVIDLLNKMANNKNYKPTFLFKGSMYKYNAETKYYEPSFMGLYKIFMILNDEVEIIEDKPEKIEKIELDPNSEDIVYYDNIENKHYMNTNRKDREIYIPRINWLIDNMNYLLEKSDSNENNK